MKRLLFRWLALGCAALFLSCKDAVRPDATGSIALQVIVPSEPAAGGPERSPAEPRGHLTSATATATSGTTTKTVTLTGGTGSATFTGTITGLAPGTYTVTVQGFVGTEVDYYGQTAGVSVTANVTTTATITFQSFVPTLSALTTPTASFRPSVSFSSVSNATSYKIEFARDAGFTSPLSSTTTTTSGSIVIADTGTYYARVRAANSAVPQGGRASSTQTFRVVTDQRPSGEVFATATNLGFFSSATVTLDSLNIYPASDDDWFQLSECNGDSLTITAQAVRLSPASPLNSVLQLYSGATARFLAGNDNADSTDARIRVQLDSDGNYRVRVSGSNNTIGHYKLVIQVKAGPNNTGSGCKVQPLAVASISSGIDHTCAVRSDGTVDCWGFNRFGQLGNGTTVTTSSPVRVSSSVTFVSVSAGAWHTCAVPSSGKAWCWGLNNVGQLGNGTTTSSSTPVQFTADFGTFSSVSAGDFHTCGLTGSSIYCWGANNFGQLGNGNTTNSVNGVLVFGGHAWAAVSAGANHTCGLTTGNAIYCW
ncbi:MAG: hypothetical protein HYW52_02230, partial [Gemmatimonadetes bacterium]|nr:hypothetical protein [Gemmatimonadota bacterium]